MMFTTRNIYIGAMALGGLVLAIASTRWPAVNDGPVPPLMSLLMVSLAFDLVIMNRAAAHEHTCDRLRCRRADLFFPAHGAGGVRLRAVIASGASSHRPCEEPKAMWPSIFGWLPFRWIASSLCSSQGRGEGSIRPTRGLWIASLRSQ